jgi:hypothetical protein
MGMRFVNVGSTTSPSGTVIRFDLVVTNRSVYAPSDPTLNGLNGRFAQVNVAANSDVDLRVRVYPSCCMAANCQQCNQALSVSERDECFAQGCCCYGHTIYNPTECWGPAREAKRLAYGCAQMNESFVLPSGAEIGMTGTCCARTRAAPHARSR